jgi:hypothetical protein
LFAGTNSTCTGVTVATIAPNGVHPKLPSSPTCWALNWPGTLRSRQPSHRLPVGETPEPTMRTPCVAGETRTPFVAHGAPSTPPELMCAA